MQKTHLQKRASKAVGREATIMMLGFVVLIGVTLALILLMHSGQWMVAVPAAVLFFAWAAFVRRRLARPRH